MIVPNFRRWAYRQTPHWEQQRLYVAKWWTPFCRLKKRYDATLARVAKEWDCKAERFVWLKPWWRKC